MNVRNNYILISVIAAVGAHAADDASLRGGQAANLSISRLLKKGGNGGGKPFDNDTEPQVCTADVYTCPDGSYVSRDPSNDCQFEPCPRCEVIKFKGAKYYVNQSPSGGGCDADGYSVISTSPDPTIAATCYTNGQDGCTAEENPDLNDDCSSCVDGETCGYCIPKCIGVNSPDDGSYAFTFTCGVNGGGYCPVDNACCVPEPELPSNQYCY